MLKLTNKERKVTKMANTELNTKDFIRAYTDLNEVKTDNYTYNTALAYVALSSTLEVCINWEMGILEIQKSLDKKTLEMQTQLLEKAGK